jgi:hypothetical protein
VSPPLLVRFTTVVGVVLLIGVGLYAYSIKQQQKNAVLLYVTIVLVNLCKNVIIVYFYFQGTKSGDTLAPYEYFLVILLLVDCVIFTVSETCATHSTRMRQSTVVELDGHTCRCLTIAVWVGCSACGGCSRLPSTPASSSIDPSR